MEKRLEPFDKIFTLDGRLIEKLIDISETCSVLVICKRGEEFVGIHDQLSNEDEISNFKSQHESQIKNCLKNTCVNWLSKNNIQFDNSISNV